MEGKKQGPGSGGLTLGEAGKAARSTWDGDLVTAIAQLQKRQSPLKFFINVREEQGRELLSKL